MRYIKYLLPWYRLYQGKKLLKD